MAKISIMRFSATGDTPIDLKGLLKGSAFREIETGAEDMSAGWTVFGDMLDTDFTENKVRSGDIGFFGLRLDIRKPDRNLIKNSTVQRIEAWIRMQPRKGILPEVDPTKVPKEVIPVPAGIRKDCKRLAREEVMGKTLPSPVLANVFLDGEDGTAYLLSTAPAIIKAFCRAWKETFGGIIYPVDAVSLSGEENEQEMAIIGEKFLTWIWQNVVDEDGNVVGMSVGSGEDEITIYLDKKISIRRKDANAVETLVIGGDLSEIKEASEAIRDSRRVTRATVFISNKEGNSWEFSFRASDFAVGGMKLPKVETDKEDVIGCRLEQFYLIKKGLGYLYRVFDTYMDARVR